jgi:hypothetical protein
MELQGYLRHARSPELRKRLKVSRVPASGKHQPNAVIVPPFEMAIGPSYPWVSLLLGFWEKKQFK